MKNLKFLLIPLFFINTNALVAQYNYGLDVCAQDARIEGKLDIVDGISTVSIGNEAGINDDGTDNGNVFVGKSAGISNTSGDWNTFLGLQTGQLNTSGRLNTFIGKRAGSANVAGNGNVYIGYDAGLNTETSDNVFIGSGAGAYSSIASGIVSIGIQAGQNNTGILNTFLGSRSGITNTSGIANTFVGSNSGQANEEGAKNTFLGASSGLKNVDGEENVYVGDGAGFENKGSRNILIGYFAGSTFQTPTSFSGNIFIGPNAGAQESNSDRLYIENGNSSDPLIYGEFDNDKVKVNGSFKIKDFLTLEPKNGPPATCSNSLQYGIVYYEAGVTPNKLRVCTDVGWMDLN